MLDGILQTANNALWKYTEISEIVDLNGARMSDREGL